MPAAGRFADHEHAANQLSRLVRDVVPQQLVGRHQTRTGAHDSNLLGHVSEFQLGDGRMVTEFTRDASKLIPLTVRLSALGKTI